MKKLFLDITGFADFPYSMKTLLILTLFTSIITRIMGIPIELFLGLLLGLVLETVTGIVVSLHYREETWSTMKFLRFFFKSFILLALITCINLMKVGFAAMVEGDGLAKVITREVVLFSLDSLFLFFMLSMTLYIILSVVENMAQTGNPFFLMIAKYLRVKVKAVSEEFTAPNHSPQESPA